MVKKEYMKPAMRVVQLRQKHHILTVSGGQGRYVKSVSNSEGIDWKNGDGFADNEEDM